MIWLKRFQICRPFIWSIQWFLIQNFMFIMHPVKQNWIRRLKIGPFDSSFLQHWGQRRPHGEGVGFWGWKNLIKKSNVQLCFLCLMSIFGLFQAYPYTKLANKTPLMTSEFRNFTTSWHTISHTTLYMYNVHHATNKDMKICKTDVWWITSLWITTTNE